ncbi:unnamed protein product [Mytilus coruscus]|uniref:G-protein coupled receptors family 1 profile domain-containing protein n=1 Tax=Mytilus coruscus TaxID=42192 RepID=A0A6J7ZUG6_MYTCO|nr:unnamed protein product [Mytilus coruscus]
MHIVSAVGVLLGYTCIQKALDMRIVCASGRFIMLATNTSSITQTAVVSIDRFQSSRCLSKTVITMRRLKLGIVSIVLCCVIYIFFSVMGGFGYKEQMTCTSHKDLTEGTVFTTVKNIFGASVFICIFVIDIPLCILTFVNIKKNCNTIEYNVSFTSKCAVTENKNPVRMSCRYQPVIRWRLEKLKFQAFKVLCLLVLSHTVTYIFYIVLFGLGKKIKEQYIFKELIICASVINFVVDPIVCILTIRRIQRILIRFVCRRKPSAFNNLYG